MKYGNILSERVYEYTRSDWCEYLRILADQLVSIDAPVYHEINVELGDGKEFEKFVWYEDLDDWGHGYWDWPTKHRADWRASTPPKYKEVEKIEKTILETADCIVERLDRNEDIFLHEDDLQHVRDILSYEEVHGLCNDIVVVAVLLSGLLSLDYIDRQFWKRAIQNAAVNAESRVDFNYEFSWNN